MNIWEDEKHKICDWHPQHGEVSGNGGELAQRFPNILSAPYGKSCNILDWFKDEKQTLWTLQLGKNVCGPSKGGHRSMLP